MHTTIIAEAGVNHNGSIELAKKLIDAASAAGADFIKFQTFSADKLVSRKAQKAEYQKNNLKEDDDTQYQMLKKLELSEEQHYMLAAYCAEKHIRFLSTGFDEESIDLLCKLDVPFFKIPSGEITNKPFLQHIASKHKPVVLSTGMSSLDEIGNAIQVLETGGVCKNDITVLHCNTEYPTPLKDVNLMAMLNIRDTFGVLTGYSDHTAGIEVSIAAVALGAVLIEKHITLDRNMPGPDHQASLEPDEFTDMVRYIRNIETALSGSGKKEPSESEKKNIAIARKSIHLKNSLKKGHVIQLSDLQMKRPGDGISPMLLDEVIGKRLLIDLPEDSKLNPGDIQ